ncbi:leucine-rich repeat-containing protein 15-like isoform X2 [Mizuhopecten yessoensis]|uniref:leucine-rich repeat-containing protein 15-like isoform X2 n=1 Tax=Mizuhopecten yessoensis TaxID=6573 RepID=UPI000B459E85|nr:leucine-rich repeat-containing protein 15-like isoform X2 [Mizuhopecten yessoensis]
MRMMSPDYSVHVVWVVCISCVWLPHVVPCPPQCNSCAGDTANCIQAGLRDIPKHFPEEVHVLDFTGNQITELNRQSFQVLPNVQSLRIPNNGISRIPADSFENIPHLTMIDLSSNSLATIEDGAFRGLQEMSIITLTNNHLQRLGQPFEGLASLSSVYLGFNQLTEIEEDDFQTNTMVRMLDLSNNRISQIHPMAFKNLKRLRYLILSNNALTHTVELQFSSTMLQLVDFTKSQLKKVPTGMPYSVADFRLGNNMITEIGDADFTGMRNLRLLMLENNMIQNISYRAFKPLVNLKEMWVSNNRLFFVPQGLPKNLETLYLDNNQIYEIQSHLFLNHTKLRQVSFEMNKIQRVYAQSFRGLQNVEQINLQFNEIAEIPAGTFSDLPALTTLQLSYNSLVSVDHGAFPPQLNSLSMSNIVSPTVRVTGQFVSSLSSINTLDFMNSPGLVSSMLSALVQSGARLNNVVTLNLQYNEIQSLPEALKATFGGVQNLLLDGNPFHCDRSLIWLKQWMLEGRVTFFNSDELECATPLQLRGRKIKELPNGYFVEVVPETSVDRPDQQLPKIVTGSEGESSRRRGGNPGGQVSSNTDTQTVQRLQQGPATVPVGSGTNPTARTNTQKARKKGRKRKGKKNRKNKNRKNRKGKKKRRNRGKRHNQRAIRRRKCSAQTDGTIKCCRVLKNGTLRCRSKRPKQKPGSKVAPTNTSS